MVVVSHWLGSNMLPIGIVLWRHLGMCDRYLAHLRRHRVCAGKGRTAIRLMGRVGEMSERRTAVVVIVEVRSHVGSSSVGRTEVRGVRHLSLVALRITTTTTSLVMITATSRTVSNVMIAHIAVGGLGRFASKMVCLRTRSERSLRRTNLSL